MAGILSRVAVWLGLKAAKEDLIDQSMRTDLAVTGAILEAHTFHEAEQYCRELESQGQKALAQEIRRRIAAISAPSAIPVSGLDPKKGDRPIALPGNTPIALPAPAPTEVPGAAPLALPAPQPEKRKPGRPRKNPVELPALPEFPKPSQNNPCDPRL